MKKLLFILTGIILALSSFGQNVQELFGTKKEVYFSFEIKSCDEIHELTKLISIDNVKGNTVKAYANITEFLKFSKKGYSITLLPSPGDCPGVVMKDHIDIHSPLTTWNYYPTYTAYEQMMSDFQTAYPSICQVSTIATLASGRKLLVAKISDNVATDEAEPEFLYTSSIHGDEVTGYVSMLHLIDLLLTSYGTNAELTDLVNSMEIYICPLANPDGTYAGGNSTVNGATRYNANGIDMNRNYPDPMDGQHPDGNAWQPETVAFMDFATAHHFVASCNFHGGAEVVNYPWDTQATITADDTWWQYISHEYVDTARTHGNTSYMTDLYASGVTNGYTWYEVNGGRQDYMNYWHHCREITIELSETKILPTTSLLAYWGYNYRSFILLMKEARYGIHGIITNSVTGLPVAAKVFVTAHDVFNSETYSSANPGDYSRLIKAGTYTLEVSAANYVTKTITGVVVTDHNTTALNIQLVPNIINTTAVSAITQNSATSGGTITSDGGSSIIARGVCWSTSASPTISGSHTTDGTGTGTFISSITGLNSSITYHVRAYATNGSGTFYGDDLTFTTTCGTISTFPWTEGFENAGVIPNCWTQEQVASSGINWTFITGNGGTAPAVAHGGTYNACLKDATATANVTRLITPSLNLSSIGSPTLTFWLYQKVWGSDQDQLLVYYRTSAAGTWTLLNSYTASITAWTQETIVLPNASADYYIDFEGSAKYGYGVCIDDVSITGTSALATLTTTAATAITAATATSGGNISSQGGSAVTARGVCWATTASPTLSNSFTTNGSGTGSFTSSITGLISNTLYHVRAYATNSSGTSYGSDLQFTTAITPTLSLSPANQSVSASSGTTSFSVTSNSAWTAVSDQAWCTVTASGSGNGTITANFTTNSVSARTANITVTVAGLTPIVVSVNQAGAAPSLSVSPSNQNVGYAGSSTSFTVTSNTSWSASSSQEWCTVTASGSGTGTLTATYAQNTTYVSRTANVTVTVSGLTPVTVTVTQDAASLPDFLYTMANDVQTSDKTLEFDLYILDPSPATAFELASMQAGILVNSAIYNGGTLTVSILSGTSELNANQQPTSISFVQTQNCIKIAPKSPPGAGNGTIIGTTGQGTRVCRLKITNTVAFPQVQANLAFNFTTSPYPTKVFQYVNGSNVSLACSSANTYSNCQNSVLNPPSIMVNLNVLLEGLYAGNGTMTKANDENGAHWSGSIADKVTVELHSGSNYQNVVSTISNIDLLTSGTVSFTIPNTLNGTYYIAIRHRNSITTVSASPVSFSTGPVSYNFTDGAGKAFGSNLLAMIDGKFVIYGGDASKDELIDGSDMSLVDNDASGFMAGYLLTDINGDGLVDGSDLAVIDNNAALFISSSTP